MLLEDKPHVQGPKEKDRFSSQLPMEISSLRKQRRRLVCASQKSQELCDEEGRAVAEQLGTVVFEV